MTTIITFLAIAALIVVGAMLYFMKKKQGASPQQTPAQPAPQAPQAPPAQPQSEQPPQTPQV
jgi:flagellar basal body-associated protein FliL